MTALIEAMLRPGIRLMQQIRIPLKFGVIGACFLIPLTISVYGLHAYSSAAIDFARAERVGVSYVTPMNHLLRAVLALRVNPDAVQQVEAGNEALREIERLDASPATTLKLETPLAELHTAWRVFADNHAQADADKLIDRLLGVYTAVSDGSNLTLDPDLDSYYSMLIVMDAAPKLAAAVGQWAAVHTEQGLDKDSLEQQMTAKIAAVRAADYHRIVVQAAERATRATPALESQLTTEALNRAYSRLASQDGSDAAVAVQVGLTSFEQLLDATMAMSGSTLKALDTLLKRRIDGFAATRNLLLVVTLLGLTISAYLIACFYLSSVRGFNALIVHMTKLASGDLSSNYAAKGRDEIGTLINSFDGSRAQLQKLVILIHESSTAIQSVVAQIAEANSDLAMRASRQTGAVRETVSRVDHIAAIVTENLKNSRGANRLAREASAAAGRGSQAVEQVVQTMQTISGSSHRIGDIITVIDEIAFQTNLLALNAAVEAARAGEHGRGFAIVASEVRNLAQRSAGASSEIRALIRTSIEDVQRGASLVVDAGETMRKLVESVHQVTTIIDKIAAASADQTRDINELNQAVEHIDRGTQQNAAMVEEVAAAAGTLREQVEELFGAVSSFTLGNERKTGRLLPEPKLVARADESRHEAHSHEAHSTAA